MHTGVSLHPQMKAGGAKPKETVVHDAGASGAASVVGGGAAHEPSTSTNVVLEKLEKLSQDTARLLWRCNNEEFNRRFR